MKPPYGRVFQPHAYPQQRRLRQGRQARSHFMRRRKRSQAAEKEGNIVTVGRRFKPKLVFREPEMQSLYDRADPPIQQLVERILLDESDGFHGYLHAARPQMPTKKAPARRTLVQNQNQPSSQGTIRPSNELVRYEFIEKLLRTPDADKTQKTLNEMMSLYQELLEKNLSDQSKELPQMPFSGGASSLMLASQQSIVVHTERKAQTLLGKKRAGEPAGLQAPKAKRQA